MKKILSQRTSLYILLFISHLFCSCNKEMVEPETEICSIELSTPIETIAKLGITPTYLGEQSNWTAENIKQSIGITSQLGAEVVHFGFLWSDIQFSENSFDWEIADQVVNTINQNGQKLSLVSPIPNTFDIDHIPSFVSFQSFDDPVLIDQFSNFLTTVLERFDSKIDYLWIGNEIDGYFEENPDEFEAYQTFFENVYDTLKSNFPKVNIGLIFTYNGILSSSPRIIFNEFPKADILGFTLYPQFYSSNPQNYVNHLQDLINTTKSSGKPIALTETTWSTAGYSGSIEKQKLYIQTAVSAFKSSLNDLEFHSFYGTYDFPKSFIEASLITGEEADWLSSLSFITNKGIPKETYCTFIEELRNF